MKRGVVIILAILAVLSGVAAARFLHMTEQTEFHEVVAYFGLQGSSEEHELIRLRITAKVSEPEMRSRIEQHRGHIREILLRVISPGSRSSEVLRDSRREVLKVLGLENKTKKVAIDVVPDFSRMPRSKEIQELLEKAHSTPTP